MGRAGAGGGGGHRSMGSHSVGRSSGGHRVSSSRPSSKPSSSFSSSSSRTGSSYKPSYHSRPSAPRPRMNPTPMVSSRHIYSPPPRHVSYGYGDVYERPRRNNLKGLLIVLILLFLVCVILINGISSSSVTKSTMNREKLNTGVPFQNDCIIDEIGWFDNEAKTETKLQNFYDKTGVQPYIVLKDYDANLDTDAEKDEYALGYYEDNIDNEGTFLYMYFAEEDADGDVGYMCYVNGTSISSMMDSEAISIFWDYVDTYWYSDLSTDDMFVKIFDSTADRILQQTTTGKDVAKVFGIAGCILLTGGIVIVLVRMKHTRDKEKAAETERILKTPLSSSETTDDLADKYTNT